MSNVIQFGSKRPAEIKTGATRVFKTGDKIWASLNKALLAVQHCALVTGDREMARELLLHLADCNLSERWLILPARFREVIENTDVEATYRAIMGVDDDKE